MYCAVFGDTTIVYATAVSDTNEGQSAAQELIIMEGGGKPAARNVFLPFDTNDPILSRIPYCVHHLIMPNRNVSNRDSEGFKKFSSTNFSHHNTYQCRTQKWVGGEGDGGVEKIWVSADLGTGTTEGHIIKRLHLNLRFRGLRSGF